LKNFLIKVAVNFFEGFAETVSGGICDDVDDEEEFE